MSRQDHDHFLSAVVGPDFFEAVIFEFLAATLRWAADPTEMFRIVGVRPLAQSPLLSGVFCEVDQGGVLIHCRCCVTGRPQVNATGFLLEQSATSMELHTAHEHKRT